ncbi:MAG: leucine-rich repeat domain-containing protein [Tannerella sp.]|jgi:hypothetical protein|nr:leucine-rich repeat domain-containing protein [Tannerella sp.]
MKQKTDKTKKEMTQRMYFITLLSRIILTLVLSVHAQTAPIGKTGLYWELNGDTLVITGEGKMPDYFSAYSVSKVSDVTNYRLYLRSPWYSSRENIYTVDIQTSGPTTIGSDIFAGYPNLVSVHIPANVTTIERYAFHVCPNLNEITVHWTNPSVCRVSKPAFMKSTFKKLTPGNITLRVPEGTAVKYQSHCAWKKFRITEEAENTDKM